jgi:transcriptional regulator with XRE-family HTH domain
MSNFFEMRNETGPLAVDGRAVRRARSAARLTQADVESRMTVLGYYLPQPYVSKLENGRYPWGFTERMASALAAALGVGISEITGGRLLSREDICQVRGLVSQLDDMIAPAGEKTLELVAA